ncbi:hypothetical protein IV203_030886 [Nitzschia inconspicua]|uniref:Fe2OG dioxygenase domain-containing protein n=1 Tax=Nitzschia inconspicua TaxID=303405 RepID=A0A9K3Q257_9STRA|nr:hypothetical protein IV203_030886 [Nitzschia inconspicua]
MLYSFQSRLRERKSNLRHSFVWISLLSTTPNWSRVPIAFTHLSLVSASSAQSKFWFRNKSLKASDMSITTDDFIINNVGGGAVNEKKRLYGEQSTEPLEAVQSDHPSLSSAYNPLQHRSHLFHAIEGLDRYPNYLSRWTENDIDQLQVALQERLSQVHEQKSKVRNQRLQIKDLLQEFLDKHPEWKEFVQAPSNWEEIQSTILDPRATKAIFRSRMFHRNNETTSLDDVLAGTMPVELDAAYLQELMDEEMFDVYSFPLLSPAFCHKLHRFVSAFLTYLESSSNMKSLARGIHKDLDNMGMGWLNNLLFHLVVRPLSAHLYKETELEGGDLDWRQGFIASYSADPTQSKPRQRLVPHTDDAEVTLNVCLGDKFKGGNLHFWGLRGENVRGNKLLGEYKPEVGRAVIHAGRHLHEVTPITAGDRFALIQWTRSWKSARSEVCPCCWLNQRRDTGGSKRSSCICGPRWN